MEQMRKILKNYINGKWVQSRTGKFRDVPNPATAEILAKVPVSSAAELDEAVQAAHKAFQDWRRMPVTKRIQYLFNLKHLLEANFDDLALSITWNTARSWTSHAAKCAVPSRTSKLPAEPRP